MNEPIIDITDLSHRRKRENNGTGCCKTVKGKKVSIIQSLVHRPALLIMDEPTTAEYLLTRPLTRGEIFLSKLSAIFINIILLNLLTSIVGFLCIVLVSKGTFSLNAFLILSLYTLLLNLLFASAGLLISTMLKRTLRGY